MPAASTGCRHPRTATRPSTSSPKPLSWIALTRLPPTITTSGSYSPLATTSPFPTPRSRVPWTPLCRPVTCRRPLRRYRGISTPATCRASVELATSSDLAWPPGQLWNPEEKRVNRDRDRSRAVHIEEPVVREVSVSQVGHPVREIGAVRRVVGGEDPVERRTHRHEMSVVAEIGTELQAWGIRRRC